MDYLSLVAVRLYLRQVVHSVQLMAFLYLSPEKGTPLDLDTIERYTHSKDGR